MNRLLALFALLVLVAAAFGQKSKTYSVLGSWILDPKTAPVEMKSRNIVVTFQRSGKYVMKGLKMVSEGTFSVAKGKVFMIPSTVNGKKVSPNSGEALGEFAEKGMVLLIDSGRLKNGKPMMYRLIRKK